MGTTIVLAQIFGIGFIVLGLSMIFNRKWTAMAVEEIVKNQGIIWIAGLITLVMGLVTVELNNVWTSGLPLLVTILSWLILIKGTFILIFPNLSVSYYRKMNKGSIFVWGGVIVLILGLVLIFW